MEIDEFISHINTVQAARDAYCVGYINEQLLGMLKDYTGYDFDLDGPNLVIVGDKRISIHKFRDGQVCLALVKPVMRKKYGIFGGPLVKIMEKTNIMSPGHLIRELREEN